VTKAFTADSFSRIALDLLAEAKPAEAAKAFRAAIAEDPAHVEAHHGLVRALRDAGQLNNAVAAAMALKHAGHIEQAEAASARARILEWKQQLQSPPAENSLP